LVIYGLLHQPSISQAWKELDAELYGHLPRNQQPMLEWDPKLTGHAQGFLEGESPGKLQDLLEFFNEGRDDPKFLARLAHDSATIRLRNEVQPTVPIPSSASPNTRPVSEPLKEDHLLKSLPSTTKHMSTPQAHPTPSPPYDDGPVLKKQRSLAHFPEPFPPKNNPFFAQPQQHPHPHPPPPQPPQEVLSPFSQPMMSPPAAGGFYDLTVTHVHPHMQLMSQMTPEQQQQLQQQEQLQQQHHQQQHQHQLEQQHQQPQQQPQQQHLLAPMNIYDDWSSLAGTVVDESVFTSAMAMGAWQPDLGRGPHPGSG
jgi:hypothetical protein